MVPETGQTGGDAPRGGKAPATVHAVVSGMVQGVGFRFFVIREARGLGLNGTVCNLSDGRVEVVAAAGTREKLERLVGALRVGPSMSRVEKVEVHWGVKAPDVTGFHIIGF